MHTYDLAVQRLLGQMESTDAREWLEALGKDYGVIHELSHAESQELVEACWAKGAWTATLLRPGIN